MHLTLRVNGTVRQAEIASDDSLLTVLRDSLDLTGTKYGCGEGQCGACTVLVDGQAVRSCRQTASLFQGHTITTIEGLEQNGRLHPVQEAFLEHEALQCGFCTPGMIMAAVALLKATPHPSDADIVAAMDRSRNMCRCGTYPRIVAAIKSAGARLAAARQDRGEPAAAVASAGARPCEAGESEAAHARA
jgi:aerobic-type carbon monoxide dehydrogenase small subunit (CoxS/CutS family)